MTCLHGVHDLYLPSCLCIFASFSPTQLQLFRWNFLTLICQLQTHLIVVMINHWWLSIMTSFWFTSNEDQLSPMQVFSQSFPNLFPFCWHSYWQTECLWSSLMMFWLSCRCWWSWWHCFSSILLSISSLHSFDSINHN